MNNDPFADFNINPPSTAPKVEEKQQPNVLDFFAEE